MVQPLGDGLDKQLGMTGLFKLHLESGIGAPDAGVMAIGFAVLRDQDQ
ncbi:MAG: hypothetical protein LPD71_04385 [Shewanella sp.]|nr:hypothetical protein [Shewanella sp.]MCF1429612.1 hypothetical protein [Shewanella sp.]MCF1438003.1 hypothetical protein [Shewanella sp.]MCF1458391.1 hypothetical protein [Shewanella sp.]